MQNLYITENGLQLKKRSDRIAVKKESKIIREYHTRELKRILIFGNSHITTDLMRHLAGKGIDVSFLSSKGRYYYSLVPDFTKNIYLRMAQYDRYHDKVFRLRFCKSIVKAKITNQRIFLIRYQRNQPKVILEKEINILTRSLKEVDERESINQLRGDEGNAGRVFFAAYGKLLLNGFEFKKRVYHPPPDPVNAMLGFGYMLVFNELAGLLSAFGIDPYLGFFHELRYGRKSLASDIIEELRSPVTDRLVLYLINKGVIKKTQFTKKENSVKMNDISRKKFLTNYESFMTASFLDAESRKPTCFRNILKDRVEKLEDVIINNLDYKPFKLYS